MAELSRTSRVNQNLGSLHIIQGRVIGQGTPALDVCNDASVTLTDTGTGNYTLAFAAFLTAPVVFTSVLKTTHSATTKNWVTVEQATTTAAEFRYHHVQLAGDHPLVLTGTATWNPADLADGAQESTDITVTGAALGDVSLVSLGVDTVDGFLSSAVTATNTVTATFANEKGTNINLASSTVTAISWSPAAASASTAGTSPDPGSTESFSFMIIGQRRN